MFQHLARECRRAGLWGLGAASIFVVSVLVGLAAAQDFEPRMPAPTQTQDVEKIRQMLEDAVRNTTGRRDFPNGFNAQKAMRDVENGANGVLAAMIIAIGFIGLLVGLYVMRRMTVRAHTRPSALDDPRMRAYMLALEGQKPEVASQKTVVESEKTAVFAERGR